MRLLATIIALAAVPTVAAEPPQTWWIVSVHDGDTVKAIDAAKVQQRYGCTASTPLRSGQPFGTKARDRLAALTMEKAVEVHLHGQDKYGRTLARLVVEGQDVDAAMIREGLAWHYAKYDHTPALAAAEREARAARRSLWADRDPVPPWEWRASEKDHYVKAALH